MNWYDDLCEYYNITPEEAIELSTRRTGRRPSFPGSITCKPVSGKTWEELWHEKPRDTLQQKVSFYRDVGAWQAFRQCNYRKEFPYAYFYNQYCKPGNSILEYGCGVAPMINSLVENVGDNHPFHFTLVDVPGEHLEFAKWRLKKKAPKTNFEFIEITHENIIPKFSTNFDFICIMDVLEHLPNPYNVMKNIINYCNENTMLVETWVQDPAGPGESDLEEAEEEREITNKLITDNFSLIKDHGFMRIHRRISRTPTEGYLKDWLGENA